MDWIKNNWKWLLLAISTLGLSLLFKKAKDSRDQDKLDELGEKEKKIINDANDQEVADVVTAGNTRAETITNAHSTATTATAAAKEKEEGRVDDLVENPDNIDVALGDMGITEKK